MGNPFVHIEISTRDLQKARSFYEKAFDWKINLTPMGDGQFYGLIETGALPGGGLFQAAPEMPLGVIVYIGVDNIEKALARVEAAGGKTIMPRREVPGEGWFALFSDPDGTVLAVWESKPV